MAIDQSPQAKRDPDAIRWPRSTADLVRTDLCPACQSQLDSSVCASCGLDLSHPASRDLMAQSLVAAGALNERLSIIERIRADTRNAPVAEVAHAAATPAQPALAREPVAATQPAAATLISPESVPVASDGTSAPIPPGAAVPPSSPFQPSSPRRSGVSSIQVVLVIVGVSLLSAGAVAFLVYAFLNYGIVWRSVIIGSVTLAAFAAATVLLRRRLRATAEGLSVLAVVLTYLDAWAARTNDFFGWADDDVPTFWGVTLVVSSLIFIGWSRSTVMSGEDRGGADAGGRPLRWLRFPHFVGWVLLPGGTALIAAGATREIASLPVYAAMVAVLATALLHPLVPIRRRGAIVTLATGERVTIVVLAVASIIPALIAGLFVGTEVEIAFSADRVDPLPSISAIGLVALAVTLHVVTVMRSRSTPALASVVAAFTSASGPVLLAGAVAAIFATHEPMAVLSILAIVATAVALSCERAARAQAVSVPLDPGRRDTPSPSARHSGLRAAAVSSGVISAIALIAPLCTTMFQLSVSLDQAISSSFELSPVQSLFTVSADLLWAVGAVVGTMAVSTVMLRSGSRPFEHPALIWGWTLATILAVPLFTFPIALTIGWIAIACVSLILLIRLRIRRDAAGQPESAGVLLALAFPGAIALLLGSLMSYSAVLVWGPTSAVVVVIILGARMATSNVSARATLLATASVVLIVNVLSVPRAASTSGQFVSVVSASQLVAVLGAFLIVVSVTSARLRGVSSTDRRVLFWVGSTSAAAALVAERIGAFGVTPQASASPALDGGLIDLVSALMLVGALLAACLHGSTRRWRIERSAASIALAPAVYLVVDTFAMLTSLSPITPSLVPATAALFTAIGSMIGAIRARGQRTRPFREVGIGILMLAALVEATSGSATTSWLPVLFVAFTFLVLAISHDGLVASVSRRRHLGWAALALATASLWLRLSVSEGVAIEVFVLPLAGALLAIAAAMARGEAASPATATKPGTWETIAQESTRTTPGPPAHQAVPAVALLALLIAIVPISVTSVSGAPLRATIIGAVSAALLLVTAFARSERRSTSALLGVTAGAGALGVLITGTGRAAVMLNSSRQGLEFDAWLAFVLTILVVAGFGFARAGFPSHHPLDDLPPSATALRSSPEEATIRPLDIRMFASAAIAIVALVVVSVLESSSVGTGVTVPLRAQLAILAFCSLHVIAWFVDIRPLTKSVAWVAMGGAVLVALAAMLADSLDPVELATTPIALALIASGSHQLVEDARTRTWPWLGPGIGILLVPSLLATITDRPIWRLVSIGVVGVAIIVIGLTRKLQSPFVIASVIVTIHAIATFSPQIRAVYESVEWWIWLIPGGIIVIVLAARLEKRVADLKEIAQSISSLR